MNADVSRGASTCRWKQRGEVLGDARWSAQAGGFGLTWRLHTLTSMNLGLQ